MLADAVALVALRDTALKAAARLPQLDRWLLRAGADRVLEQLATAALWLAAAWLALGLLAALAALLPGAPGRICVALCRVVLPRAARKLLAGTAGLSVLLAPAAALASPSGPAAAPVAAAPHSPGTPLPPPTWPTSEHRGSRPTHQNAGRKRAEARVQRGDCLWLLAARHLPPSASDAEIAAYWPRWYATNRKVIGADPDLLHPGEALHVPSPPPLSGRHR